MFKTTRASRKSVNLYLAFALTLFATASNAQNAAPPKEAELIKPLQYRSIGPYRGGRSAAVAGVPSQPFVYYYGATGGGVWKTTDGGINWEPVSDGSVFGTGSVGAIAVADSDPNTVYVGMGDKIPLGAAMNKGLTIKTGQTHVQAYTQPLLKLIQAGDIDPSFVVTHPASLEDAPAMYKKFRDKEDGVIKVVMRPGR